MRSILRSFIAILFVALAYSVIAGTLFVTNERAGTVTAIDTRSDQVITTFSAASRPRGIAVSRDGKRLFVAVSHFRGVPSRERDGVLEIDAAAGRVVRRYAAGTDPEGLDLSADGRQFYVANEDAGTATVVDTQSGRTVDTFVTGTEPEGIAASPDGRYLLITAETSST